MRQGIPKREGWCNTCEYFVQHYVWAHDRYVEADGGHCIHGRGQRRRRGTDIACENWTEQTEEYRQRRVPLYHDQPQPRPVKEYCVRVQVFEEM